MCLALPGRVVAIVDPERHLVTIEVEGATRQVSTAMLDEGGEAVAVGDWLEVHLGMAFAKIDEAQAQEILSLTAFLDADEPPPGLDLDVDLDPRDAGGSAA